MTRSYYLNTENYQFHNEFGRKKKLFTHYVQHNNESLFKPLRHRNGICLLMCTRERERECVCVCVCVTPKIA